MVIQQTRYDKLNAQLAVSSPRRGIWMHNQIVHPACKSGRKLLRESIATRLAIVSGDGRTGGKDGSTGLINGAGYLRWGC